MDDMGDCGKEEFIMDKLDSEYCCYNNRDHVKFGTKKSELNMDKLRTTHIKKDGQQMLIAEMDDSHLLNMIRMLSRGILDIKSGIDRYYKLSPINRVMFFNDNDDGISIEDAQEEIENRVYHLQPYLFEAWFRPQLRETVGELMCQLFERDGSIEKMSNVTPPALSGYIDDLDY